MTVWKSSLCCVWVGSGEGGFLFFFFFKILFIYFIRKEGREKESEKNSSV